MQEFMTINLSRSMATFLLFLSCFDSLVYCKYLFTWNSFEEPNIIAGVNCVTQAEIDQHLTLGMNLLARGAYSDALSHFHAAVDADPNNYMSYYKRATVYLAMSRSKPALSDLDQVLKMKPDFVKARQQRAGVLLKMGHLDDVTKLTSGNTRAYFKLSNLHYQMGEVEESLAEVRECLKLDPEHKDCYPLYKKLKKVAKFLAAAKESRDQSDWEECVINAQKVLKNEPTVEGIRFHAYDRLSIH